MDIHAQKLELIKMIADIESERIIAKLRALLQRETTTAGQLPVSTPPTSDQEEEPDWITAARAPTPDVLDVEMYQREQGYDGAKLQETLKNWDQSLFEDQTLEELLNTLTK